MNTQSTDRLLRCDEVVAMVGLSRPTLWRLQKLRRFPQRLQVGPNSVRWRESEILAWIQSRPAAGTKDGTREVVHV
ncbi:MAG: AlpA family transcriptional regulator [Acidobacteria bacterium]|nr:AlpA family transcriptional regulator [Acidobacteriota bacterium]